MRDLDLNIAGAYDFYKKYLLDLTADKAELFREYGFKTVGTIPSHDWELFGAILLRDKKVNKDDVGADLERHEVKSAVFGSGFEYQYHREHGEEKLLDEASVDHLFFSYKKDYKDIEARLVYGEKLAPLFDSWLPQLRKNYSGPNPRQRFRRSVSYKFVQENGVLLVRITDGRLSYPTD